THAKGEVWDAGASAGAVASRISSSTVAATGCSVGAITDAVSGTEPSRGVALNDRTVAAMASNWTENLILRASWVAVGCTTSAHPHLATYRGLVKGPRL